MYRFLLLACLLLQIQLGAWAQPYGRFVLKASEPKTEFAKALYQDLLHDPNNRLVGISKVIGESFKLPKDIDVIFTNIGEVNCYYSAEKHHIVVSYEFIEYIFRHAVTHKLTSEEALNYAHGTLAFSLLHEMGHCLFEELKMPVVGREEDAADEFATILLVGAGWGPDALLGAADWFTQVSAEGKKLNFWDEHSLDQQRVYNILLMLYAENPSKYSAFVSQMVPKHRMARALWEHKKKYERWNLLLRPYTR